MEEVSVHRGPNLSSLRVGKPIVARCTIDSGKTHARAPVISRNTRAAPRKWDAARVVETPASTSADFDRHLLHDELLARAT
jgi:hypothetical protein